MLSKLNLPTLQKRRQILALIMFYKIKHQLVNIQFPNTIRPALRHRYSFPRSNINTHRHSFFPRTAKVWNTLPPDICNSPDLGSFRAGLLKTMYISSDKLHPSHIIIHHIFMHQSLFISTANILPSYSHIKAKQQIQNSKFKILLSLQTEIRVKFT